MSAYYLFVDIIIAFIIDLIAGDPYWMPHPVRFIGWLVKKCEGNLRGIVRKRKPENTGRAERLAGGILMVTVVSVTFIVVFAVTRVAYAINPILFHVVNIYFIYSSLATRCLANEAVKVYSVLKTGDLRESRKRLAMLVGRQTDNLNEEEITRGVIETTAENTVDGIISPMLYAIAGSFFGLGAPLAYAFKAASTLDSMVGYMNERYGDFGRVSAKTDDAANYVPARLSGLIIPAAAFICGLNCIKSFKIMLRDRRNHKSPNCAYPEAAFAGALGIKIGGTNIYFGMPVVKPTIGDADKATDAGDIMRAVRLTYVSAAVTLILGLGFAIALLYLRGVTVHV